MDALKIILIYIVSLVLILMETEMEATVVPMVTEMEAQTEATVIIMATEMEAQMEATMVLMEAETETQTEEMVALFRYTNAEMVKHLHVTGVKTDVTSAATMITITSA